MTAAAVLEAAFNSNNFNANEAMQPSVVHELKEAFLQYQPGGAFAGIKGIGDDLLRMNIPKGHGWRFALIFARTIHTIKLTVDPRGLNDMLIDILYGYRYYHQLVAWLQNIISRAEGGASIQATMDTVAQAGSGLRAPNSMASRRELPARQPVAAG